MIDEPEDKFIIPHSVIDEWKAERAARSKPSEPVGDELVERVMLAIQREWTANNGIRDFAKAAIAAMKQTGKGE